MTEDEKQSATIIKDRRRVDEEGRDRNTSESENIESTVDSSDENKINDSVNFKLQDSPASSTTEPEINFASFVVSLATQAMMQMGEMQAPPGVQVAVDKIAARQSIEILAMLQSKTVGNLDSNEKNLIEEVLHTLRMSFLKMP